VDIALHCIAWHPAIASDTSHGVRLHPRLLLVPLRWPAEPHSRVLI
jgi:hypothetical protein